MYIVSNWKLVALLIVDCGLRCIYTSENFPRNGKFSADRMRSTIFSKKKSYCACGRRKTFRSVENFLKCICTLILILWIWNGSNRVLIQVCDEWTSTRAWTKIRSDSLQFRRNGIISADKSISTNKICSLSTILTTFCVVV